MKLEDINENKAMKKVDAKGLPALNPAIANSMIKAMVELDRLTEGEMNPDEKSLARQLIDLNPDMIDEDPMDYAVSVKK